MTSKNFFKLNTVAWIKVVISLALLFSSLALAASNDIYTFNTEEDSRRFNNLTQELRCLVCQNQSLADSDATLAKDLRHKIYIMINENKSDQEIKQFLVTRYGAFILFSPPFSWKTSILWLFPAILLSAIFGGLLIRKRRP
ncbi:MAG TPA: cytochrome c-type biogenesis protein [Gammaproteobacteria bacterium]|nr:cytochrome c-type biogenesis protein [Gammaproteobacteria bacterium]